MLQIGAGRCVPRRPQWVNLQRDILELFCEAQSRVVEDARTIRARIHEYYAYMSKVGFNHKERMQFPSVEIMRIRNSRVWNAARPEPEYPCPFCEVWNHTKAQRSQHIIHRHGGKDALDEAKDLVLVKASGIPNAVVYRGAESLKKAGWI